MTHHASSTSNSVLVCGATGQQGGAVINALLQQCTLSNITISALTRDPRSAAAQELRARAVNLVRGDLGDRASLQSALSRCDVAYLVTDFRGPDDVEGEIKQGRLFIDAAVESGVKHLVFSSVAGADAASTVQHFSSKHEIEKHLTASGLSYTILRPCGFIDVIPPAGVARTLMMAALKALIGKNVPSKWIACEDIGQAAAKALLDPSNFAFKTFTLAGDVLTSEQLHSRLDHVQVRRTWRLYFPRFLIWMLTPFHYREMFDWLASSEQPGSVSETRLLLPDALTVEEWAQKHS